MWCKTIFRFSPGEEWVPGGTAPPRDKIIYISLEHERNRESKCDNETTDATRGELARVALA